MKDIPSMIEKYNELYSEICRALFDQYSGCYHKSYGFAAFEERKRS